MFIARQPTPPWWRRRQPWDGILTLDFEVGGQQATIKIDEKYGGFAHGSNVHLDGHYVEPLQR